MTDRTKTLRMAALAAACALLTSCANSAGTQESGTRDTGTRDTGTRGSGETTAPRAAEAHQHIVTYNDVRITPSVVPGVHTYFGYSNSIVSKQRFRLMVYDYPELLQTRD